MFSRALSCLKTRNDLVLPLLLWWAFSRFAHGSIVVIFLCSSSVQPADFLGVRPEFNNKTNLCSTVVCGGVFACSSPVHGGGFCVLRLSFKRIFLVAHGGLLAIYTPATQEAEQVEFLSVRSLFDRTSAIPLTAWSQATVSGSADGTERAYRPASAHCPGSTAP